MQVYKEEEEWEAKLNACSCSSIDKFRVVPFDVDVRPKPNSEPSHTLAGRMYLPTKNLSLISDDPKVQISASGPLENGNGFNFVAGTGSGVGPVNNTFSLADDGTSDEVVTGRLAIVLVHQYSMMGGSSSLMEGMATRLAAIYGMPSVTFDMRGVGDSTGRATVFGTSEVNDVVAVCKFVASFLNCNNIILVGSSAGAPIAGSAISQVEEIKGFVAIGYVFGFLTSLLFGHHYKTVLESTKPKLFIHGDCDGFTSTAKFESYFRKMNSPKDKVLVPGVGHFELEAPHYDRVIVGQIYKFVKKNFGHLLAD